MKAWITARRLKAGSEHDFRTAWAGDAAPEGMVDAYLFQSESDPRTTYSVSLWDAAEKLLAYHTSDEARRRDEELDGHAERTDWSGGFVAWKAAEIPHSGGRRWLIVPAALALAGGLAVLLRRRMRGSGDNDAGAPPWLRETTGNRGMADMGNGRARGGAVTPMPSQVRPIVAGNASAPEPRMQPAARSGDVANTTTGGSARPDASRRPNQLVREVMTANPETVRHDDTLENAARLMRDLNAGFLPVLADGRLAGVITDRDITIGLAGGDHSTTRVGDLMTEVPITISPHVSVQEAARLMADHQVRRLPVVEGARLVGIISLGDIAEEAPNRLAGNTLEEISQPSRPER